MRATLARPDMQGDKSALLKQVAGCAHWRRGEHLQDRTTSKTM